MKNTSKQPNRKQTFGHGYLKRKIKISRNKGKIPLSSKSGSLATDDDKPTLKKRGK